MLNSSLTIVARQPVQAAQFVGMRVYGSLKHDLAPTKQGRALWMVTKKAANWAQRHIDPARPWLLHKAGFADVALLIRAEQSPNPDSRVTLGRSEEHTSELQSLMRISYAVFCLKKKNNTQTS